MRIMRQINNRISVCKEIRSSFRFYIVSYYLIFVNQFSVPEAYSRLGDRHLSDETFLSPLHFYDLCDIINVLEIHTQGAIS